MSNEPIAAQRLRTIAQGTNAPAGHPGVNVPVAMGRLLFAPEIRGYRNRHPRLAIELSCSDRTVDLINEGVDCALRGAALSAPLDGSGLIVLAEFVAGHYLTSGALLRVLPGWQCPSLPLRLVTPPAHKGARPAASPTGPTGGDPLGRPHDTPQCPHIR